MNQSPEGRSGCPEAAGQRVQSIPSGCDRYSLALGAALTILKELDTLPKSNMPVRLAKVIFIVLDAIYEAERQLQAVQQGSGGG